MASFDLSTESGMRAACVEAERRLGEVRHDVGRVAGFLDEIHRTPLEERESAAFQQRIWDDNPIAEKGRETQVGEAWSDPDFRRQFQQLLSVRLPEGPQRSVSMDRVLADTLSLVTPFVPPRSDGQRFRPINKTIRVFAVLFPNDFTTLGDGPLRDLLKAIRRQASPKRKPALVSRRILDHVKKAIGPVDIADWDAVARRMMIPRKLHEIRKEQSGPSVEVVQEATLPPDPPQTVYPPPIDPPELDLVTQHFESMREAGSLIFDRDVVESVHLGLWARDRRHFAVLTGLSGTGKTQLSSPPSTPRLWLVKTGCPTGES